jgi:hypothetical protein
MTIRHTQRRGSAAGQVLVIMALAMVAVIAMVGLVIDGGNAWANQRIVQNGSDAGAEAGAVVMAQRLSGANPNTTSAGWDALVSTAVTTTAAANGITVSAAYYTDVCGIPLTPTGGAALTNGSYNFGAADLVGSGSLPTSTATTPNCPSLIVGPPAGVLVLGHKSVSTYFAKVVGISTFGINSQATAVAGYGVGGGAFLPVTIPVLSVTCGKSGNAVGGGAWPVNVVVAVPLCGNSPGNVGWLDWTPPNGGTSELVCSILHPNNPAITFPSWQYVTSTGNVNGGGGQCGMSVEDALDTYDGQVVTIPMFDLTCNTGNNSAPPDSSEPAIDTGPNYGCPAGDIGGNGQNQWYRMPSFASFKFCSATVGGADFTNKCITAGADHGAYISDSGPVDKAMCNAANIKNGATSCLVGMFVSQLGSGTVGTGVGGSAGNSTAINVQLIK